MPWYAWAILALVAVSSALNVLAIGKPRQPLTPAPVVAVLAVNGLIAWAIVALAIEG